MKLISSLSFTCSYVKIFDKTNIKGDNTLIVTVTVYCRQLYLLHSGL